MTATVDTYTECMADESPANPWPERLKALQESLGMPSNEQMAARLGVTFRSWISWKYGQRKPSAAAQRLIEMLEQGKI